MRTENPIPEGSIAGFGRRNFLKYLAAGSALSLSALEKLNASVYQSITSLNQKYIEDESPDGVYWDTLRRHFLFQDGLIMMNNGTLGPMPKPVFDTLVNTFRIQLTNPFDMYNFIPRKREEVRRKLAEFLGVSADEVVMTRNTTEGMNFIANGLEMQEGDEVLISSMEHPAGLQPWRLKEKRCGIRIVEVPVGLPPRSIDEFVGSFAKAVSARTKIISVSHTIFISGLISPLKELCAMAHDKGIPVLADGAHAIGMLDLNLHDTGVDFYATSPYKWMGAPTGIGVLYMRESVQDKVWPTIASSGWDENRGARKFETLSQRADAIMVALGEALDFQNRIGKSRIERRIKALAGYLKRELKKIPGLRLHSPEDPYLSGGLVAFSVEGLDPAGIVEYMRSRYNIVIRTVGNKDKGTFGIRVSTPIFVTMRHIDRLLEGMHILAEHKAR